MYRNGEQLDPLQLQRANAPVIYQAGPLVEEDDYAWEFLSDEQQACIKKDDRELAGLMLLEAL
jgi:hypothetical protein